VEKKGQRGLPEQRLQGREARGRGLAGLSQKEKQESPKRAKAKNGKGGLEGTPGGKEIVGAEIGEGDHRVRKALSKKVVGQKGQGTNLIKNM